MPQSKRLREWKDIFLPVVDERTNVTNCNKKLLVCSDYTMGCKPLSLIESPGGVLPEKIG